ncbi:MAG TPA: hypothetical protein VK081_08845 [Planctomycetota bacterium]|nr:hypothetical protein [Planctomycetota bacterium]
MKVSHVRPHEPVLIQRPASDAARPAAAGMVDRAELSDAARQAARTAERHAARLRMPDTERRELVDAARRKLEQGDLASEHVLRETARRMLEQGGF